MIPVAVNNDNFIYMFRYQMVFILIVYHDMLNVEVWIT